MPPIAESQSTLGRPGDAPDRRLFASSWPILARRGGAQIIYSEAAGRQLAPHAGVISPRFLLPCLWVVGITTYISGVSRWLLLLPRFPQRRVRNAARSSSENSCGCSQAAKWPPRSAWLK